MEYSKLLPILIMLAVTHGEKTENVTEKVAIVVPQNVQVNQTSPIRSANKTIDKLVQEQTDLIKKIISNHKMTTIDYPVVTRKEGELKDVGKIKEIKEKESIEELRKKCQELSRLEAEKKILATTSTTRKPSTTETFSFRQQSQLLPSTRPANFFYVTRRPTTISNQEKSSKNDNTVTNKYATLQPLILQKTFLNDGRVMYQWYKPNPSAPQSQNKIGISSTTEVYQRRTDLLSKYDVNYTPLRSTPSTSTTATPVYQQKISDFGITVPKIPNYELGYKRGNPDNSLYKKEMKFVIQMPLPEKNDFPTLYPWLFDPYAYAPKELQPKYVNIPTPYVPSYHMIRMLQVPKE